MQPVIPGLVQTPPRPEIDKKIRSRAVDLLYPSVKKWLESTGETVDEDENEIKGQLLEGMSSSNGYEFAKYLDDDCYWGNIDSELVEILDTAWIYKRTALTEAITKWVGEFNITTPFQMGDQVKVTRGLRKNHAGSIVGVRPETATVTISTDRPDHQLVINIEDLEKVEVTDAEAVPA